MTKNAWIAIVAIVVIILLGWVVYAMNDKDFDMEMEDVTAPSNNQPSVGATTSVDITTPPDNQIASFTVTGKNYSFDPKNITVKKGTTVKITFVNASGMHDLHVEGYGVGTSVLQTDQSETITFVADKTGDFQYYCAVGNHRAMGMFGTLHVTS